MVAQRFLIPLVGVQIPTWRLYLVAWESGYPLVCKTSHIGSNPIATSKCPHGGTVDTRDLKSLGHCGCVGSNPTEGTKQNFLAKFIRVLQNNKYMKFKTLLTKLLFTKKQRNTIWRALVYSEYKYRQRGNVDAAVEVQIAMNEVEAKLGMIPQKFTKSEVDRIVNNILSDSKKHQESAYLAGIQDGKKQAYNEIENLPEVSTGLAVGTIIDPEKCKGCEHKNDCVIGSTVTEEEENDEAKKDDTTDSATSSDETSASTTTQE